MALEGREEVEPTLDQTTRVVFPVPMLQVSVKDVPVVTEVVVGVDPSGPDTDGVTGREGTE